MAYSIELRPEKGYWKCRLMGTIIALIVAIMFLAWILLFDQSAATIYAILIWSAFWLSIAVIYAVTIPFSTRNISYILEEDRLIVNEGIFTKTQRYVLYKQITDLTISQGILERHYGVFSLRVRTTGSGAAPSTALLLGIGDPEKIRTILLGQKKPLC